MPVPFHHTEAPHPSPDAFKHPIPSFISIIHLLSVFLLSLISLSAFSSAADTTKPTPKKDSSLVYCYKNNFVKYGSLNLSVLDTGLTGFQNYDPLISNSPFYASLGNIGQFHRDLSPYPFFHASGFDYGFHTFDNYLVLNDSVNYYKVYKAYTNLIYEQGANKEIFFNAIFSRNIVRGFNLGFNFMVFNAPGAYLHQRTSHVDFVLTGQYFTRNRRYGFIANFIFTSMRNNENGGIKSDSLFEQNIESNRQIIPVKLETAQNRINVTGFFMKHYFDFLRHNKTNKDTLNPVRNKLDLGRFTYSFEYSRQIQNYIDNKPKSGFYPSIYLDSTLTFDSITTYRIVNEIAWTNPSYNNDNKYRILQLEARFKQLYAEVRYAGNKKVTLEYIPSGELIFHPYSTLLLHANADYVIGGYNNADMSLKVDLKQTLGSAHFNVGSITIKGFYCFQTPGYFYEHYYANNFRWDTTWKRQNLIAGGGSYSIKGLEAGFMLCRLANFVYLNEAAKPAQYADQFGYLHIYLNNELDLWRFKFKGQFIYQTVQGASVLRLPVFIGNLTIYFTQELFKSHATLQPGMNFFYNTRYYADNYMPATRSFFLQDSKQIGDYLYMDIFINLKIQRARFFFKYSNFSSLFLSRTYYMTPGYPMPDAAFRFGISWMFHD